MSISKRLFGIARTLLLVAVVSICVAEVAYRVVGVKIPNSDVGMYTEFGDVSFRLRPNSKTFQQAFDGGFLIFTNDMGFRVREGDEGWTSGGPPLDILITGNSLSLGWGLEYEDTFGGILAERAREQGKTVANTSVGAHGGQAQLELLRWLVKEHGLRAKTLMYCMGPEDVRAAGAKQQAHVYRGHLYWRAPSGLTKIKLWFASHSASYTMIRAAWHNLKGGAWHSESVVLDRYRGGDRIVKRGKRVHAELEEFKALAKEMGARLVVLHMPYSRYAQLEEMKRNHGDKYESVAAGNVPLIIRNATTALAVPLLDFQPTLDQVAAKGVTIELAGDPTHYCAEAHVACADYLTAELLDQRSQD